MKTIDMLTRILLIVGGLNWGLVGVAGFNLVATLFGEGSVLSNIVYTVVGISALVQAGRLLSTQGSPMQASTR